MHMVTNYLGHVNVSILVVQYDEHLFLVLLVHYYNVLMPNFLEEVKVHNFDFECECFLVIMGTNAKKRKKLVTQMFGAFHHYHVDVDNYICVHCFGGT